DDRHASVRLDRYVHEEVEVGDDVLLAQPEGRQGAQKVRPAARRVLDAVAKLVALGAAAAADRVVAAAGVLDDREQAAAQVRVDAVAAREKGRLCVFHGVGGVVTLFGIPRVVAEEIHGLPALEVDDSQDLPAREDPRPRLAGRDHAVLDHLADGAAGGSGAHGG